VLAKFIWLVGAPCEHGNEYSGSLKGGELLDYLKDSAPLSWSLAMTVYVEAVVACFKVLSGV
jgi:hypothetical protein